MNLSTWKSNIPKKRNPATSSAHVIIESDRTSISKISNCKLGQITFESKDLNSPRDRVIEENKDSLKYKNISNTYIERRIVDSVADGFPIFSHGQPLGGDNVGYESCSRVGISCADGEGTDQICNRGKCVIGHLNRIKDNKWEYISSSFFRAKSVSDGEFNLKYFLNGDREVNTYSVLRGNAFSFSDNGPLELEISSPASVFTKIILPPVFYFSEYFSTEPLLDRDIRLNLVFKKPTNDIIGILDRRERFLSHILLLAYPNSFQKELSEVLYSSPDQKIKNELELFFSTIHPEWVKEANRVIGEKFEETSTNKSFVLTTYSELHSLFQSCIQVSGSSIVRSSCNYRKDDIARPVYSRLPGIAEAYRSDPLFSDNETPAQWLTSGVDEFLSQKKDQIVSFYQDYLDPQTCSPGVLDWLAQHVGLFGDLWDERWDRKIKVAMIENAFGWWDREKTTLLPGGVEIKTPKGEVLSRFPFTSSELWTQSQSEENFLRVSLNEIGTILANEDTGETVDYSTYMEKTPNTQNHTLSLTPVNKLRIYDGRWNGLMESKGSLLSFAFLSSMFGLKAHSAEEIKLRKVINTGETFSSKIFIFEPKSGLRQAESSAPPLWPYKSDVLQVGDGSDLESGNFTNQIIAGVSRVTTPEDSKNVFFRLPYYYNRDGKSWDRVGYIAKNWMPDNLNKVIQYPYLSADLWAVGDGFFEPEFVSSELLGQDLILTEDAEEYINTEDSAALTR